MKLYVGVTDFGWFDFLRRRQPDEVNFWRPTVTHRFAALQPGEMFLFKPHAPRNFIVGGGVFSRYSTLPLSVAWSVFSYENGVDSFEDFLGKIRWYQRGSAVAGPQIGCIVLEQPFFLPDDEWIPWPHNIGQQGKTYEAEEGLGRDLWQRLQGSWAAATEEDTDGPRGYWGRQLRRAGQNDFRVAVIEAYGRQCAVTQEHTLPVLEAAHIRPFAEDGPHDVNNGLLLRTDVHKLFDLGYATVDEHYRFVVSGHLRDEWNNGKDYYRRHGSPIVLPSSPTDRPSQEYLEWHRTNVFIA